MAVEKLFKDEATEEKGDRARMASFVGAMAIADLVKTTLEWGKNVTVTNDDATILKSLHIDNPAAKVLIEHHKEGSNAGVDVISGAVGDMAELRIYDSFKVKQALLLSATEAAEMILRVDEIITCAPQKREERM